MGERKKSERGKISMFSSTTPVARIGMDTVAEGKDADWEAMIQSNVLGVLRDDARGAAVMPRDAGASIINIGSRRRTHGLTRAARPIARPRRANCKSPACCGRNFSARGIRVGTVDPGLAETEFSLVRFKGDARKAQGSL